MGEVFIYWDNSNIFVSAKEIAVEHEGEGARPRVRIHFRNLLELARAGRPVHHAVAVGSVPPELRYVWNRLENEGVDVRLLERGAMHGREEGVDQLLQTCMLRDLSDYNGDPGIAVLLTGDGAGFYESVTFLEAPVPGQPVAEVRNVRPLDLTARALSEPRPTT